MESGAIVGRGAPDAAPFNSASQRVMSRYVPDSLDQLLVAIASKCGVSEPDAQILADALVDADLHGMSTHGVSRMNIYMRRIQKGLINPRAELAIDRRHGSVLSVDAGN